MRQEGSLAGRHDDAPGLPRGRSSLPADEVRAAQRQRLMSATVAAVAAEGYHAITVADIVRGARVSKAAFYVHFRDKEDCFLATTAYGGNLLVDAVIGATRSLPPDAEPAEILRAACRAFLRFLADEPAFARVFYVDMPAAGSGAVNRMDAAQHRFAELNRSWHRHALSRHPDWPSVPYDAYLALAGATTELVSVRVRHNHAAELPELEDTLVALHMAVLAAQRWPEMP
ncbi:TetR/AcrR family transcriptional regulator [Kutzneria sp. CA-103260]|uniref:TetR/AcrR family transcriptional regulator n=1 Tax=Kutzneria sp. CA-103260 TaxID=2802641 RepID=UPI001BA968F8|nr:TetR/AcrR family transcriptional regulator [Kutzneria sp. CA-103260]QUQ62918.1 transcriptional regulatory protein [Kutzneria sp. CA-103260]